MMAEDTQKETWQQTPPGANSFLPDMGDFFFLFCFFFPTLLAPNYLFTDGSTGWHLATGRYILDHGTFPRQEFMSYTMQGKDWLPLYWLSDYVMAAAEKLAGLNGLAVLCSGLIAMLFLLVYKRMRASGCHIFIALPLCFTGAIASTVHWLARPVISSFLGVYFLNICLADFYSGKGSWKQLLLSGTMIMILWVNAHPAFVAAYPMIGIYLGVATIQGLLHSDAAARKSRLQQAQWFAVLLALSGLATLVNPFGPELPRQVFSYLGQVKILDSVDEYMSPVFHGALQMSALELLFFALFFGLYVKNRLLSVPALGMSLAFFHLTLNAVRNIPLFAMVSLPFAGELYGNCKIDDWASQTEKSGGVAGFLANLWTGSARIFDSGESGLKLHLIPVVTVLVFAFASVNGGKLFDQEIVSCSFPGNSLPTKSLDFIKSGHLESKRGFNHVNWGGYIYYKAGIPIFIDDRSAFFGEGFYTEYGRIVSLFPGWKDLLEKKHRIDWVVFPKDSPLSNALLSDPDWQKAFEDQASFVFVKKTGAGSSETPNLNEDSGSELGT